MGEFAEICGILARLFYISNINENNLSGHRTLIECTQGAQKMSWTSSESLSHARVQGDSVHFR